MAMQTFGETGWNESSGGEGSTDFFNMRENKKYRIRIIGNPHKFAIHWVTTSTGKRRVTCAADGCVLCAKGKDFKASIRYLIPAYVHNEEKPCLIEFGGQVYSAIKALAQSADWGNPREYDIVVDRDTRRPVASIYMITPGGAKRPLTAEQKQDCKAFMERVEEQMKTLASPSTNEVITEKLGTEICAELGLTPAVAKDTGFESFDSDATSFDENDFDTGDYDL